MVLVRHTRRSHFYCNMCRKYRRRYLLQDLFPVSIRLSPQKCILLGYEVIVLRITSNGLPQVIHETWITGKRLFLCAGEGSDGKVVNVLAYRIVSGRFRVKTSPLNGVPKIFFFFLCSLVYLELPVGFHILFGLVGGPLGPCIFIIHSYFRK